MAQWGKRRAAGVVRGFLIGLILALLVWLFYVTGVLNTWLEGIPMTASAFWDPNFLFYLGIMIFIIAVVTLFIRSTISWGGA